MPIFNLIICLLTLATLISDISYADLVDHLKFREEKSDVHKIPGIDFIYMINLDQRPEKFERPAKLLEP